MSTSADERHIEETLRTILGPLDRHLERGGALFMAAFLGAAPVTFLSLWLLTEVGGKKALGWAAAAVGVAILLGLAWDALVARLARWRFNAHFPAGTPTRETALRVLVEMETPSRAEHRLLELLTQTPARRIRRRPAGDPMPSRDAVPAIDPVPPAVGSHEAAAPASRSGYYDYIPLQPRAQNDEDRPPLQQG